MADLDARAARYRFCNVQLEKSSSCNRDRIVLNCGRCDCGCCSLHAVRVLSVTGKFGKSGNGPQRIPSSASCAGVCYRLFNLRDSLRFIATGCCWIDAGVRMVFRIWSMPGSGQLRFNPRRYDRVFVQPLPVPGYDYESFWGSGKKV